MNKFLILFTLLLAPAAFAGLPERPFTNFTLNFWANVGLQDSSEHYASCHSNATESIYALEYLPVIYQSYGMLGVIDNITAVISDMYDLNETCILSLFEISISFNRYLMKFKLEDYISGFLRELPMKILDLIKLGKSIKNCFANSLWGCAGANAGKLTNKLFYVTPLVKTIESESDLGIDSYHKVTSNTSELVRKIINMTINFLEASNIIPINEANDKCRGAYTFFYPEFLKSLDMLIDKKQGGARQLLYSFKALHPMYRECKNLVKESIKVINIYIETIVNGMKMLENLVFRCKPLMSRGKVMYYSVLAKDYETVSFHAGYLLRIFLS